VPLEPEEDRSGLERIHVVYSSDAVTFPGLLLGMLSVSRSLEDPGSCTIHVIVPEEDAKKALKLLKCYTRELYDLAILPEVKLHVAKPLGFNPPEASTWEWIQKAPRFDKPSAWALVYLHMYLPDIPRAIYLDTDTLVTSDLGALYRMKMHHALAASWDLPVAFMECFPPLLRGEPSWAFDSGVLLLDLKKWASRGLANETERWIRESRGCWGDQLSMSSAVQGEFDRLPWAWNVKWVGSPYWLALQRPCLDKAHIFHWTGGYASAKPWLHTRNKAMDYKVKVHAPCLECPVLPKDLPSLCAGPRMRANVPSVVAGDFERIGMYGRPEEVDRRGPGRQARGRPSQSSAEL